MYSAPGRIIDAIRSFKSHSIYIRNFVVSAVFILLPLAGFNVFLYRISRQMVTHEAALLSQDSLGNTRDVFDSVFRAADYLAASIALEAETELYFLSENAEDILGQDPVRAISARLKTAVYANSFVHSVYVYSESSDRIVTHIGENERSNFADGDWYDIYTTISGNRIKRVFRRIGGVYPLVISLIKPFNVFGGERNYGAIVVNIDIDELKRIVLDPDPNSPEQLYVLDDGGTILFATDRDEIGRTTTEVDIFGRPENRKAIVSTAESRYYPWRFVSIHALETYNLQSAWLGNLLVAVIAMSLAATVVAAFLISNNSYRPIRRILSAVQDAESVHRLDHDGAGGPSDETRYIAAVIARFAHTNSELRKELDEQLGRLDRARMTALQIQINPHFLNNTLEVVSMSARRVTSGENELTRMIALLSRLLRTSLDTGENIVPLVDEIEHARVYVDILRLRYADRFDVAWRVPENLLSFGMLKLSLQPLIENAFYHGIKPTRTPGHISIEARRSDTELLLSVWNTGRGISRQEIGRIRSTLGADYELDKDHVGLRNVDQRVRLVFGPRYGVSIDSDGRHGTRVTIRIPVVADVSARR